MSGNEHRRWRPAVAGTGMALWQLWCRCFRLAPGLVFILGLWGIVGGTAQILLVLPSARIVKLIGERPTGTELRWQDLLPLIGTMCALIALAAIAHLAVDTYAWRLGRMFNGNLRVQVMSAVSLPPSLNHLEDPVARTRLSTAIGVGPARYNPGGAIVRSSHRAIFAMQILTAVVILCWINIFIGLIIAMTILACRLLFSRSITAYAVELIAHAGEFRRVDYLRTMIWEPSAARELRVFTMWPWLRAQIVLAWEGVEQRFRAHRSTARRTVLIGVTVFTVGFGGAFILAFADWSNRRMSLQAGVVAFEVMVVLAVSLCRIVVDADQSVELGTRALPAAAQLIRSASLSQPAASRRPPPGPAAIRCTDLSFRYPWSDGGPVLHGLTFAIEPGESMGIVGPNGAGKSTLLKLICGFYPVECGSLTVDGIDSSELDRSDWQRNLAAVQQDFARYPRSLLFNVAPERGASVALVRECLADAGLPDLPDKLPHGLDTLLVIDAQLSGGQWQRIAIARALYRVRAGARLLLLDEPTANLDPMSEVGFTALIAERASEITTITVSHRLPLMRNTHKILVLQSGRLVESGSHDELMATPGLYSAMFQVQSAGWARR